MNKCIVENCDGEVSVSVETIDGEACAWVCCPVCLMTGPVRGSRNDAVKEYQQFEKVVRFGRLAARICPTCDTSKCQIKEDE